MDKYDVKMLYVVIRVNKEVFEKKYKSMAEIDKEVCGRSHTVGIYPMYEQAYDAMKGAAKEDTSSILMMGSVDRFCGYIKMEENKQVFGSFTEEDLEDSPEQAEPMEDQAETEISPPDMERSEEPGDDHNGSSDVPEDDGVLF